MNDQRKRLLKIALLDLYEGVANQGMRCIREIVRQFGVQHDLDIQLDEFEVRLKNEIPSLAYDLYISSGGPGSPTESKGSHWENLYFQWIEELLEYNHKNQDKKNVFFICHSFQLACRYFEVATVNKRKSMAFGVFPIHFLNNAAQDPIFSGLNDPFYAVDSRDYQVVQPQLHRLHEMGAEILAIEKARPHVPYERAVMAIRFNEQMIGTQFHPEADAEGMLKYLHEEERKKNVIENHGLEKWESMVEHLNDPDKILHTNATVLPNFLHSFIHP